MQHIQKQLKVFLKECTFVIGAAKIEDIPQTNLPEVAFIGRSNVGKSGLINALVNRNSLARVSQNPGCTQQINFFNLADKMLLVDLPGYGYARISQEKRQNWQEIIYAYLHERPKLKRAFILIDSRHEIKDIDIQTMTFLDRCAVSYQIVLTKIDKISHEEHQIQLDKFHKLAAKHHACVPIILSTSSKSKVGIDDLRLEIAQFFEE
jgi:GTP-binding protein